MRKGNFNPYPPITDVRERAADILAAVGPAMLGRIALFRAEKWTVAATKTECPHIAENYRLRAAEWSRIGRAIPSARCTKHPGKTASWRSTMSDATSQCAAAPYNPASPENFKVEIAEMVADQAPRVFAIVLEYGEQIDAQIIAWGMALDEVAYMSTVDGRNHFALADPENALNYIRRHANTTPHLVWAAPTPTER